MTTREEMAAWLEANCPESQRQPLLDPAEAVTGGRRGTFPSDDARLWLERMAAQGWVAPTWPVPLGGAGLDAETARDLAGEMKRLGIRPPLVSVHGLGMIGPALLEFGTPEQQLRFLPDIANGRQRWCQGFSEPGAGSDLAGLSTRATRDGDEYVVTGQKTWTSFASASDWIFAVVRTNPSAPKRDGLSMLLVDLDDPGITVRPITLIDGTADFCEVFFDDVRVPIDQRLGAEGDGWAVTRFILGKERQLLGSDTGFGAGRLDVDDLIVMAGEADPLLRDALAAADIEREACRALLRGAARRPAASPLHPSVVKLALSNMMRNQADLSIRVAGSAALGWSGDCFSTDELALSHGYLYSRTWTIAGGTSEIQRNILARQVLGLPHLGPEEP